MVAIPLFPRGFHSIANDMLLHDIMCRAPRRLRATTPIKYYFTDFSTFSHFTADSGSDVRLELFHDVPNHDTA